MFHHSHWIQFYNIMLRKYCLKYNLIRKCVSWFIKKQYLQDRKHQIIEIRKTITSNSYCKKTYFVSQCDMQPDYHFIELKFPKVYLQIVGILSSVTFVIKNYSTVKGLFEHIFLYFLSLYLRSLIITDMNFCIIFLSIW